MIEAKAIAHGDSPIDYGTEKPKYRALARTIAQYYRDLLRPLEALHGGLETLLGLPHADMEAKTLTYKGEDISHPFMFTRTRQKAVDTALDVFLTTLVGPDRSEAGFVKGGIESDTADGIIQQHNILAYAVGLQRGSDLLNRAQTLQAARNNPATEKMLENAFARLSSGGELRLETVRDEIHGILAGASEAGLNPLDTAQQLSKQFDGYRDWEFQRLARTEAAYASEEGVREQMEALGVTMYQILVDVAACSICLGYAEQMIPADGDLPPYHPNCLCTVSPAGIGERLLH